MQMNLLRKVSLFEFRAASSSDAVKPTPSGRSPRGAPLYSTPFSVLLAPSLIIPAFSANVVESILTF